PPADVNAAQERSALKARPQPFHARRTPWHPRCTSGTRPHMRRPTSARLTARIVIVDDDEYVREVTDLTLSEAGHTVPATGPGHTVGAGGTAPEAVRWLGEESCALLIIDLRMREMDGPTLPGGGRARGPNEGPRVLLLPGCTECPPAPSRGQPIDCPVLIKP